MNDRVSVTYIRDGAVKTTELTLTTDRPRFRDRYAFRSQEERDPCKVFIGITSTPRHDGGRRIGRIIKGTSAAEMDLQVGDVILEMDGVEVNSFDELLDERDQNEPGDYFKLTILRDGERKKVRGQFKPCDEEEEIIETPQPEIEIPGQGFDYERFEAFPNPTFGEVNISFTGKAVPTIIRLTDVTGKVVYEDSIENFDGIYQEQVQLRNRATPGAISLTVIQEGQAVSKSIVLLSRA